MPFPSILQAARRRLASASRRLLEPAVREISAAQLSGVEQQSREILEQLRQVNGQLSRIALRESQVRAIMLRDAALEDEQAGLRDLLADPGTAEHVSCAVQRAALHRDPFPYAVIDDLLPKPVYAALLKGIPPVELFADRPPNKQQLTVPFALAPAYSRSVWRFVTSQAVPDWIVPAVLARFRAPIDEWIAQNWPGVPPGSIAFHSSDGRILRRERGYRIPPHRDPKWAFLTGILYLARRKDSEAWGTQFYTVDRDEEAPGPAPHWIEPERCRQVKDIPFRPNRLLVFLNSVGAHGACIPDDAQPETLDRYIYQFRIGPTVESMATLKAALPEDRRPFWAGKSADY